MKKFVWLLMYLFFLSCGRNSNMLYTFEKSGSNRGELELFLSYYSNNRQKKQAAEFLISGMSIKHHYSGGLIEKYDTIFHLYDSLNRVGVIEGDPLIISNTWNSLERCYGRLVKSNVEKKWDCQSLSADFLIDNVEQSFSAWKSVPDYVSKDFKDFCEFVLPYKSNDEVPEKHKERYFKEFVHLRDTAKNVVGLLLGLNRELYYNQGFRNSNILWKYPLTFPVSKMDMAHRGACRHTVALYTWIMRACGLPVAVDFVKSWGNRSQGHEWNVLMLDSGRIFPFDSFGINRLEFAYKPAKIFRRMYSLNNISEEIPSLKDVPGWLLCSDEMDVTSQYGDTYDISIPCIYPWTGDYSKKHGIICVFDNKKWKPVYWGEYKNDKMTFLRMMGDVCYMAAYYDNGKIVPATSPFILQKDGKVRYLTIDKQNCKDMILKRKYPRFKRMDLLAMSIRRGIIEGAKDKQFSDKDILLDIAKEPKDITDMQIVATKKYRYVRIRPVIYRTGDIAEIEFFGKKNLDGPEQKLTGRILGSPILSSNDAHPYTYAMDNDYDTYFSKPKNEDGYVGLDLGTSYYITRVRLCPRSDGNFIVDGHTYELCYWDEGKWISAGKKVAQDITIEFNDIPRNTFYILHDLTKGKEERIFTYENGLQVWW